MDRKVNVLATEYEIVELKERDKYMSENDSCGYCCFYDKKVYALIPDSEPHNKELNEIIRHELVHAFLYECGLSFNSDWATNEEIVDWIAIQFPKINALFANAGVTS